MLVQMQVRRGLASEWSATNPTLESGEVGLEIDTIKVKYGNGVDAWNDLAYQVGTTDGAVKALLDDPDSETAGKVADLIADSPTVSPAVQAYVTAAGAGYGIPAKVTPLTTAVAAVPSNAAAFPAVAASPATFVLSPTQPLGGSPLTTPRTSTDQFTLRSGTYSGQTISSIGYTKNTINEPSSVYPAAVVETDFYGDDLALGFYNGLAGVTRVEVWVDDIPQTASGLTTPGDSAAGLYYARVTFPSPGQRRVRFVIHGGLFHDLTYQPTSSLAAISDKKIKCAIFGDSWVQGALNVLEEALWPNRVGRALGWDIFKMGQGGSGYTQVGSGTGVAYPDAQRVAQLAASGVDVAIVYGSQNDDSASSDAVYTAAVTGFLAAVAAGAPNLKLIMVGPPRYTIGAGTALKRNGNRDILRNAALGAPNVIGFIDQIGGTKDTPAWAVSTAYTVGQLVSANAGVIYRCTAAHTSASSGSIDTTRFTPVTWFTGTGKSGSTTGDGNCDLFIGSDGAHMTTEGHDYFARRVASAVIDIIRTWVAGQIVSSATTISASPASGTPVVGDTVTLTANVAPFIPGTVQFYDGLTAVGSPATVNTSGVATRTTTSLTAGAKSLSAVFTPTDATKYAGSSSTALSYTVLAPPLSDIILTDLLAEFDANDLSALTDGATVSSWACKRGAYATPLTQATSANRPTYRASSGGHPAVEFAAASKTFMDAAFGTDEVPPLTLFVVHEEASATPGITQNYLDGVPAGGSLVATMALATTNYHTYRTGTTGAQTPNELPPASTSPHIEVAVFNGLASYLWHNTRTKPVNKSTGTTGTAGLSGVRVGAAITATTAVASGNFNGKIRHVVAYRGVMADGDIVRMLTYLASRWGVTLAA